MPFVDGKSKPSINIVSSTEYEMSLVMLFLLDVGRTRRNSLLIVPAAVREAMSGSVHERIHVGRGRAEKASRVRL